MRRNIRKLWWPVYEALEEGTLQLSGQQAGLCRHILDRVDSLWTFLDHEHVELTNNASERALRHAVIWRKLSFGTQSDSGSRFVETLLSVIETCRQQSKTVLQFVTQSLTVTRGKSGPNGTPLPVSIESGPVLPWQPPRLLRLTTKKWSVLMGLPGPMQLSHQPARFSAAS